MLHSRPAVLSGQEKETGPLLVVVAPNPSARVGRGGFVGFWHTSNVDPAVPYLSGNFN